MIVFHYFKYILEVTLWGDDIINSLICIFVSTGQEMFLENLRNFKVSLLPYFTTQNFHQIFTVLFEICYSFFWNQVPDFPFKKDLPVIFTLFQELSWGNIRIKLHIHVYIRAIASNKAMLTLIILYFSRKTWEVWTGLARDCFNHLYASVLMTGTVCVFYRTSQPRTGDTTYVNNVLWKNYNSFQWIKFNLCPVSYVVHS